MLNNLKVARSGFMLFCYDDWSFCRPFTVFNFFYFQVFHKNINLADYISPHFCVEMEYLYSKYKMTCCDTAQNSQCHATVKQKLSHYRRMTSRFLFYTHNSPYIMNITFQYLMCYLLQE